MDRNITMLRSVAFGLATISSSTQYSTNALTFSASCTTDNLTDFSYLSAYWLWRCPQRIILSEKRHNSCNTSIQSCCHSTIHPRHAQGLASSLELKSNKFKKHMKAHYNPAEVKRLHRSLSTISPTLFDFLLYSPLQYSSSSILLYSSTFSISASHLQSAIV